MIEDLSWGYVVLLGAGASGLGVVILSLIVQFSGAEEQLSYVDELIVIHATPLFVMWAIFVGSSHFTIVSGSLAVLIALGIVVATDYVTGIQDTTRTSSRY